MAKTEAQAKQQVFPRLHLGSTRGPQASPQIPYFTIYVTRIDGQKWLEVTCGRCKQLFMVLPRVWRDSMPAENYTRPCPYCFKAGRIPTTTGRQHGPH